MKLIKDEIGYSLWDSDVIASTEYNLVITLDLQKLSKQNCDEIFGIVDVEKLAEETMGELFFEVKALHKELFKKGFNKAMELNKDKLFTVEDMISAYHQGANDGASYESACGDHNSYEQMKEAKKESEDDYNYFIESLQQPKEIEVEIEMEIKQQLVNGYRNQPENIIGFIAEYENISVPKLDENGFLILKKK
jgi:hypothetical protein